MPNFVLIRNYTLRPLFGHTIEFKTGKSTHVPPTCVAAAVAIGAESVDGPVDILPGDYVAPTVLSPDERRTALEKALDHIAQRAEREDFTASGIPTKDAIVKEVGFDTFSKEYAPIWTAYLGRANAEE